MPPGLHPVSTQGRPGPQPLRADARLRLEAEACLPRRFPQVSCPHCAAACPTGALRMTRGGPVLGTGCVDCGQCVAPCPSGALHLPGLGSPPSVAAIGASTSIAIDCWRVPSGAAPGAPGPGTASGLPPADSAAQHDRPGPAAAERPWSLATLMQRVRGNLPATGADRQQTHQGPPGHLQWRVPCLGALTPTWLLEIMVNAAGRPLLLQDRGLCADCPAGGARHPAVPALARCHHLLAAIGLPAARWPRLQPGRSGAAGAAAPRAGGQAPEPLLEARLSRRMLLTGGAAPVAGARDVGRVADGAAAAPSSSDPADNPMPEQVQEQVQVPERASDRARDRARLLAALQRLAAERPPALESRPAPPAGAPAGATVGPAGRPRTDPVAELAAGLTPSLQASAACADHRVCASACPTGALRGYRNAQGQGLCFDPTACTGCTLCVQLCPTQALHLADSHLATGHLAIDSPGAAPAAARPLTRFQVHTCPDCGALHSGLEARCSACDADRAFARDAFRSLFGGAPAPAADPGRDLTAADPAPPGEHRAGPVAGVIR
ncbi:MAG: hypothetical protein EA400_13080 [Chromatiaceae bacterium]|nr:MAG: hypothetical protein EA400_13080 [Chromatiaceae bacterium]